MEGQGNSVSDWEKSRACIQGGSSTLRGEPSWTTRPAPPATALLFFFFPFCLLFFPYSPRSFVRSFVRSSSSSLLLFLFRSLRLQPERERERERSRQAGWLAGYGDSVCRRSSNIIRARLTLLFFSVAPHPKD